MRGFVGGKLRRDPLAAMLLRLAEAEGFGHALDLGCGRGHWGLFLLAAGAAGRVTGIDRNAAHLAQASDAAAAPPALAFAGQRRDLAAEPALPEADTVLLLDVLYQLAPDAQARLLDAAMRAARRRIVIRTADPAQGLRSALTAAYERVALVVSPHSGDRVAPPDPAHLAARLRRAGFATAALPCWRGTPFANLVLDARRA
ncbi:MAG: class I SAM-dependent methyltransferase [Proteobacteria bacterium]|nr:class I SAM-dependent methyltransferase [Pseudomonadota bacterium]